jgi:endoglucanase
MKHIVGGRNGRITLVIVLVLSWGRTCWVKAQNDLWATYKNHFVSADGRVVDTGNGRISHSEGQGYGMLLAESNADQATFSQIWNWTIQHLSRSEDHLFAWRWRPLFNGGAIDDHNDAADGDLLIAWALLRGADRWKTSEWHGKAVAILNDVKRKLIRSSRFGPLLLPGVEGFQKADGVVVNLSYWLFPAFKAFGHADRDSKWNALEQSGLQLLSRARFGALQLPPDWLLVHADKLSVAGDFEAVYGYNAVRIPLYLAWARITNPSYYEGFARVAALDVIPAKIPLNGPFSTESQTPALPGMVAIYQLVKAVGNWSQIDPPYQQISADETYYSASLGLLTNLVVQSAKQ